MSLLGVNVNERGLGGHGSLTDPDMSVSGHFLTFVFECFTDLAFIPPLVIMAQYRRHFEIYVGIMMLISAFAYNFLDAMNRGSAHEKAWSLVIGQEDWHRVSNVFGTTYVCVLLIHLTHIADEDVNLLLRYLAFTFVAAAQIKDGFWMQETHYTIYVVVGFAALLVFRYFTVGRLPEFMSMGNFARGVSLGAMAGICFYLGLDDVDDEFRFAHGCSHIFGGVSLTFLWNLVPRSGKVKGSDDAKPNAFV